MSIDARHPANPKPRPRLRLGALLAGAVALGAFAPTVLADGATVTRGDFAPFTANTDLPITGRAQMVRTADGKTIVSVHVEGLDDNTTYGAHVHAAACDNGFADGHYKFDAGGPALPPNEIWPGFTTNDAGAGNGNATVLARAGEAAVSVVVHAPGGTKIACADLI